MLVEWVEDYCQRSGDDYIVLDGELAMAEQGFCTYKKDDVDGVLFVYNCYGDGRYWEKFLREKAKEFGCSKVRFATRRNPRAFERRFGAKVIGYIMEVDV